MANEVFKTPGVYVKETDNTFVRDSNNTTFGTGAITLKANQGPVNQRILFTRFADFQQVFGKPTSTTDYGHFAARLYMSVAPSLYVVRASYGDESYATIQFPSEDAYKKDEHYSTIFSAGNPNIKIKTNIETNDLIDLVKIGSLTTQYKKMDNDDYVYYSEGIVPKEGNYYNLETKKYGKGVFSKEEINASNGKYLKLCGINGEIDLMVSNVSTQPSAQFIPSYVLKSNKIYGDKLSEISAIDSNEKEEDKRPGTFFYDNNTHEFNGDISDYIELSKLWIDGNNHSASTTQKDGHIIFHQYLSGALYYPVNINIKKEYTLNNKDANITTYVTSGALSSLTNFKGDYTKIYSNLYTLSGINTYEDLVKLSANSIYNNAINYDSYEMSKLSNVRMWEDNTLIDNLYVSGTPFTNSAEVRSISFRDFEMGDDDNWLTVAYASVDELYNSVKENIKKAIYQHYGTNAVEAKDYTPYVAVRVDGLFGTKLNEKLPSYISSTSFTENVGNLKNVSTLESFGINESTLDLTDANIDVMLVNGHIKDNEKLFITYRDANDDKIKTNSIHQISEIEKPTIPVNSQNTNVEGIQSDDIIKPCVAIPTNQALVMYPDGYTKTCDTDEEPGNGDLEQIKPWCGESLVFGAVGPGKYANDLGIAIISPEMYEVKALNIPNGFDWRWGIDDEDKNRNTPDQEIKRMLSEGSSYTPVDKQLVWTQIYKVNVYKKPSDKTAEDAWGTGKEAIVSNIPVESFLVSNNPKLVDGEGKSLYAPNVINKESNYIYVTRKSVQSMGGKLPKKTYGIFPLVGGEDGTKSTLNQKQAALQLYNNPNKANFDLIFNTDAIESFQTREKARAAQIKFGEIAGSRGDALAIVQATSKEAKKLSKALAEGKGFSFEYPSHVAMFAGYDKYFDPDLSSYVYLPKSVAAAVTQGWIMYNRNPWEAIGGTDNGSIEYTTGNQLLNIDDEEYGELYSNNINGSRTMPIYGEVLWGNKTAQKKDTALRSINVRVLMNYIKKNVKTILLPYIFQINNDVTRSRMKNQLENFMGGIEKSGGCTNSHVRVWCSGEDIMKHIVRVELGFIPPYTIEYIPVNIVLDSASNTIDILEA